MSEITNTQKKIIWTIVRKNGIDTDVFRDFLLKNYGTKSTRKLTEAQAANCIMDLKIAIGEKFKPHTSTWGITPRQIWKVRKIAGELGWEDPGRVDGLVKKMFYGKLRLELLNKSEASKLIVALQKMSKEVENGEKTYA